MIFHNTKIELCAETGAGCRRMKEMDENTLMEEKIIKLYKKWKGGLIKMLYPQLFLFFDDDNCEHFFRKSLFT